MTSLSPGESLPPWLRDSMAQLFAPFAQQRAPHALLLSAPEGGGLELLCRQLIGRLLCHGAAAEDIAPCGHCRSCHWLHTEGGGYHPDLHCTMPARAGAQITVDPLRAVINFVNTTSHQGGWRIAWLMPAECMNTKAANALLKSLEEPPSQLLFLLASHNPWLLPATVRSRCQQHSLPMPTPSAALAWLGECGLDAELAVAALAASRGLPLAALAMQRAGQLELLAARRRDWERLLVRRQGVSALAAAWQDDAEQLLLWLADWLSEAIRHELSDGRALAGLSAAFESVLQSRHLLGAHAATNLRPRLVLEQLLHQCLHSVSPAVGRAVVGRRGDV